MRLPSKMTLEEIRLAITDLDRRLRRLEEDTGEQEIVTSAPRAPKDRTARIWYDETDGKIKIITASGIETWSKD